MTDDFFSNPKFYTNRELSWLLFEERVLNEAYDPENRLFDRLKFLSITGSNLDEFFMIRVATLKTMAKGGNDYRDISGLLPSEQLKEVSKATHKFVEKQYDLLNTGLMPGLRENNIFFQDSYDELGDSDKAYVDSFYEDRVFPVITPVAIDSSRPFPILRNNSIYVGGIFENVKKKEKNICLVQIPKGLDRLIILPDGEKKNILLIEDLIKAKLGELFSGHKVTKAQSFRVIRDADFEISADFEDNLLTEIKKQVEKRETKDAIRLEIRKDSSPEFVDKLMKELALGDDDVYYTDGPVDLTFLMRLYEKPGYEELRNTLYEPVMPWEFDSKSSLFSQISEHDLMLIHPFESFKPVIDFINEAAEDKDVLAIKQTLYRVSGNSPIVNALVKAAGNGKQVTVLVELKARFDEENNIEWARLLEKAGCNVIYGFPRLKTHCKITLVVRREEDRTVRYVHLGTGNYNDSTAKQYTDISFFTAKPEYGEDASNVFNMLSGYSKPSEWKKMSLAPDGLREKFISLIEREAEHAKNNEPSHIIAKMNSLCDKEIIEALYKASCDGVKIDLIVRGICSLKTGIKGVSENITVRSIVGNYLEHSRIYYFKNGGDTEYFCSSADWMPRNMDKRIEILFPVERKRLREKLNHVLKLMLKDNTNAWILESDGTYRKRPDDEHLYSFQEGFALEEKNTKGSVN